MEVSKIIARHAKDDFEALMTAQGMENAGACVFSITWTGKYDSMMAYVVFGKYEPPITPDEIDKSIERVLFPED